MATCVAYGCTNRSGKSSVTFHSFPKESARRSLWIKALRRKDWEPSKHSRICSDHFREADIDRTSLSNVRLRDGAVPCIFSSFPSYMQRVPKERRILQKLSPEINSSVKCDEKKNEPSSDSQELLLDDGTLSPHTPLDDPTAVLKRKLDTVCDENQHYRKKIRRLQQSNRRLKKRNSNLNSVLKALQKKNYIDEESVSVLKSVSGISEQLLSRQFAKATGSVVPWKYDTVLRSFARTLNFYSPRAYEYVRSTFDTCLPHPRTISKWYQSVDGEPGFTSEAFEVLRKKVASSSSDYPVLCSLIMDYMAIRQHVEFDGHKYFGYVDMGSAIESDSLPLAKEAMVFMLVGINGNWKMPVGYFLIASMNRAQRANLVRKCIVLAECAGVKVVSLTCDGAASNLAMATSLGCCLDPLKLCSTFRVTDTHNSVALFLDPPHMLKLVRNTLGDRKELIDNDGNAISWSYIQALHEVQESEGVHLANKLRSHHVNWVKSKMKVSLATQLFSDSVADALEEASSLGLPAFVMSSATANFIRIMNNLFDILNSRSMVQSHWKKPINVDNYEEVNKFLFEVSQYLLDLKLKGSGELVIHSNWKTGFVGFLVCISSLQHLYVQLIQRHLCTPVLKYLPMYKCSQDHVEIMFGIITWRME